MSLSCRDPLPPAPLRPRYVYVRQELIPEEKSAAYAGAGEEVFGGGVVVAFESADPDAGNGSGGGGRYVICPSIKKIMICDL